MLNRRDPIFWMAAAIFVVALALAAAFGQGFLLLMVGAYLLRPTLHSLGFFRTLADEREMQIQYRAGNVAFATMVLGVIVVIARLMTTGDHAWEMLVPVLLFGLAARALARLLMEGDLAVAGPRIVIAVGLFLVLFGLLEGGVALPSTMSHGVPGLALALLGLAARKRPRPVAFVLLALAALVTTLVVASAVGVGRQLMWGTVVAVALIVIPVIVAAVCLLRASSSPNDDTAAHDPPGALSGMGLVDGRDS